MAVNWNEVKDLTNSYLEEVNKVRSSIEDLKADGQGDFFDELEELLKEAGADEESNANVIYRMIQTAVNDNIDALLAANDSVAGKLSNAIAIAEDNGAKSYKSRTYSKRRALRRVARSLLRSKMI